MATKQEQLEYWAALRKVEEFQTLDIYHPNFGHIYLLANKFKERLFSVDGTLQTFKPVSAKVPNNPEDAGGQSRAQIEFGRIGIQFRQKLRLINDNFEPIQCAIRTYQDGSVLPTKEWHMFFNKDGVQMDEYNVTVTLGYDNPSKLSIQQYYSPDVFTGLQNL